MYPIYPWFKQPLKLAYNPLGDEVDDSQYQERFVRGAEFGCCCPAGAAGIGVEGGEGFYVNQSLFFGFEAVFSRIMYLQISDYALVIERGDGKVVGVEVRASMTVRPEDFSGLSIFAEYAGDRFLHGVLFYSGDKVLPFRINSSVFHAVPISSLM